MTFKYLNIKLGVFALGLVVIIAMSSLLGASERVNAATASADCGKSVSGQEQTCGESAAGTPLVKSTVTAWFFPPSKPKAANGGATTASTSSTEEGGLSSGGLPPEALILFAAALAGIAFLGRRRKMPVRKD